MPDQSVLTGRCYCGQQIVSANSDPLTVAYCHCKDCRRVSGAPVSALAAFDPASLQWAPKLGAGVEVNAGVHRWFCKNCGSPLAAEYDYLPDQVYVPVGLFDQDSTLEPRSHSHADRQLHWVDLADALPRAHGSNRDHLVKAKGAG